MEKVEINCSCGFRFLVASAMASTVFCPKCGARQGGESRNGGQSVAKPVIAAARAPQRAQRPSLATGGFHHPRIRKVLWVALGLALAAPIVGWILASFSAWLYVLVVPGVLFSWWYIGKTVFLLMTGLGRVLREKEIEVLKGVLRLIAWDPIEGVVLLKHKTISFVDDRVDDGGGVQLMFPILGEELAMRVPLDVQTMSFKDSNVLTREYIPLSILGTVYWKIVDLERFYLFVSREIHHASDRGTDQETAAAPTRTETARSHSIQRFAEASAKLGGAEEWLRMMAEQVTRRVVARASTGLLFAEQIAGEASAAGSGGSRATPSVESSPSFRSATESLAADIHEVVGREVEAFGIEVRKVALQEVRMPSDIRQAAVEACKSTYELLQKSHDATARKMMLEAGASVIGVEAMGLREIAKAAGDVSGIGLLNAVAAKVLEGLGPKPLPRDVDAAKPPQDAPR